MEDRRPRLSGLSGWIARASCALFGLAVAVGIAPSLQRAARPGDLPSALQSEGLSASGPTLQFAFVVALIFLGALLGTPLARVLAGRRWAFVSCCIALASSPIPLMHFGNVRHVLLHGVAAAVIVMVRKLEPRFSRADVLLIPTYLACYFALIDIGFGRTPAATALRAALLVFALRLIAGALSAAPRPAYAFALAPLALLLQLQWLAPLASGIAALAWLALTPLALARLLRTHEHERLARKALAYVIYPIVVSAYPLALLGVTSPVHVEFFEDGHDFTTASELVRGERPYRDFIPMHGLVSDGVISAAVIGSGHDSLGALLGTRRVIAALNLAAIYAVAFAATGMAEAGLLAALLTIAIFPASSPWVRSIPSLLTLAFLAAATRLRSRRFLAAAGVALVIAVLFSIDLALYTTAVVVVVLIRWSSSNRERWLALRAFGGAALMTAVPLVIVFAILGFAGAFFSGTWRLLATGGVYTWRPLIIPECLRSLSAIVAFATEIHCLSPLLWFVAMLVTLAALADSPLHARRGDAVWYVGLWVIAAGMSWVMRDHGYYEFALGAFLVAVLVRLWRGRMLPRGVVIIFAVILVLVVRPFGHLLDVATPLRRAGGLPAGDWKEYAGTPRSRGAVVNSLTIPSLDTANRFLATNLKKNETFFDFANAGLLYYLFDRNCPLPYYEVPLYESEAAQREVIATLERDRSIRAALIDFPDAMTHIDNVPNRVRAPLVWRYLEQHFAPALDEHGVVFWIRR